MSSKFFCLLIFSTVKLVDLSNAMYQHHDNPSLSPSFLDSPRYLDDEQPVEHSPTQLDHRSVKYEYDYDYNHPPYDQDVIEPQIECMDLNAPAITEILDFPKKYSHEREPQILESAISPLMNEMPHPETRTALQPIFRVEPTNKSGMHQSYIPMLRDYSSAHGLALQPTDKSKQVEKPTPTNDPQSTQEHSETQKEDHSECTNTSPNKPRFLEMSDQPAPLKKRAIKKNKTGKRYSNAFKKRVIKAYNENTGTTKELAKKFKISSETLFAWLNSDLNPSKLKRRNTAFSSKNLPKTNRTFAETTEDSNKVAIHLPTRYKTCNYDESFKDLVISEYLNGKITTTNLCSKYKISSATLYYWTSLRGIKKRKDNKIIIKQ